MLRAPASPRTAKRLLAVGLAIATLLAVSLYLVLPREVEDPNMQDYTLTIRVEPTGFGNYTVRIPLMETSNETPSAIDENSLVLGALGSADGRIVETPYGTAFEVNASEKVEVNVQFQKRVQPDWPYGYFRLSMCLADCSRPGSRTYPYAGYFASGEVAGASVFVNLTFEKITSRVFMRGFYLCRGTLTAGWGELEGLYRVMLS